MGERFAILTVFFVAFLFGFTAGCVIVRFDPELALTVNALVIARFGPVNFELR